MKKTPENAISCELRAFSFKMTKGVWKELLVLSARACTTLGNLSQKIKQGAPFPFFPHAGQNRVIL